MQRQVGPYPREGLRQHAVHESVGCLDAAVLGVPEDPTIEVGSSFGVHDEPVVVARSGLGESIVEGPAPQVAALVVVAHHVGVPLASELVDGVLPLVLTPEPAAVAPVSDEEGVSKEQPVLHSRPQLELEGFWPPGTQLRDLVPDQEEAEPEDLLQERVGRVARRAGEPPIASAVGGSSSGITRR